MISKNRDSSQLTLMYMYHTLTIEALPHQRKRVTPYLTVAMLEIRKRSDRMTGGIGP